MCWSQPARLAHGAVCEQGHRRAAGQAGGQAYGGQDAATARLYQEIWPKYWAVKESCFRSTGFRAGHSALAGDALDGRGDGARRRLGHRLRQVADGAGGPLPLNGRVFISVSDAHKADVVEWRACRPAGFELTATSGTAAVLQKAALRGGARIQAGPKAGPIHWICSRTRDPTGHQTPAGQSPRADEVRIRTTAVYTARPIMTTISGRPGRRAGHRRAAQE